MELEEAKQILNCLSGRCKKCDEEYCDSCYIDNEDIEAIDTVISELFAMQNLLDEKNEELDRLQKENEELSCIKKAIKVYKTDVGTENRQFVLMSENEFLNSFNYKCLLDDYVSKDKIREMIEELECTIIKGRRNNSRYFDNIARACAMRVLQDLLKEE